MLFKLDLCQRCAANLRVILRNAGEEAMAKAIGRTLCRKCRAKVPGYEPGRTLETVLKKTPPEPEGNA